MRKIVSILIVMAMILVIFTLPVQALSFKFTPSPSATELEAGDTITVDLKLSDIDAGEKGINTFNCVFKYDETIFEQVSTAAMNNWTVEYNSDKSSEQYGNLLIVTLSSGVKENVQVGQITLKVKEDAKGKSGNITFTNVATNDGTQIIEESDKTINVSVKGEPNAGGNQENTNIINDGSNANNGNSSNVGSSTIDINKQNTLLVQGENISKEPIPQTGWNGAIIFIVLTVISVVGVIAYIKYKKVTN